MSEATLFESATDYLDGLDLPPTPFDTALESVSQRVDLTVPAIYQTPLGTVATTIIKQPAILMVLLMSITRPLAIESASAPTNAARAT